METDTIVAVVTPPGEGGVGIVRASGPLSTQLPSTLFPRLRAPWKSHRLRQSVLVDPSNAAALDQAAGCLMAAPRSYTGEDVFEIHCHGSPILLERVVQICLHLGCRPARPGEFTLRAFLNGRLDLSQAEAVLDVVRARSNAGLQLAARQLSGWLTQRVEPVRHELIGVLAHMEAMVDFVEDDIPPQIDEDTISRLRTVYATIEALIDGSRGGIVLREGATLAIVGSPNVGKSSIMNALLGMDRSIVTPIAGTTRDTVEETIEVRGVPFRTVDTAGITVTADLVERIGVERSRQTIAGADVVLFVLDRSRPWSDDDELALAAVDEARDGRRIVVALNKSDLPRELAVDPIGDRLQPVDVVESSTVLPDGLGHLRVALEAAALGELDGQAGRSPGTRRREWVAANSRHRDALQRASAALTAALDGLSGTTPLDLVAFDVRAAAGALGEISGISVDDELLDRIFRDFCIGK